MSCSGFYPQKFREPHLYNKAWFCYFWCIPGCDVIRKAPQTRNTGIAELV